MKSIIATYYHDIESIQQVSDNIKEQWQDEIGQDYLTNMDRSISTTSMITTVRWNVLRQLCLKTKQQY